MPKYKMQVWVETCDRGVCVIDAKDEETAKDMLEDIVLSGDHAGIQWERSMESDMTIDVVKVLPPDTIANFTEEEDADA